MDTLSKTSLVVMIDDPLISGHLGEFLNQIQGGLLQGSAKSGLHVPRGSVLISSNNQEVARYGAVLKFIGPELLRDALHVTEETIILT